MIGNRIEKKVSVNYAYQEIGNIPERFSGKFPDRTKPWGTGQAILCCKDVVNEPFLSSMQMTIMEKKHTRKPTDI